MLETYEYQHRQPLPCQLTIYGGLQDTVAPAGGLRAWSMHTSAACTVRMFNGDHFFIHNSQTGFIDAFRNDVLSVLSHPQQLAGRMEAACEREHGEDGGRAEWIGTEWKQADA